MSSQDKGNKVCVWQRRFSHRSCPLRFSLSRQADRLGIQITPVLGPTITPHSPRSGSPSGSVSPSGKPKLGDADKRQASTLAAPPIPSLPGANNQAGTGAASPTQGSPSGANEKITTISTSIANASAGLDPAQRLSPRERTGLSRLTSSIHRSPRNSEAPEARKFRIPRFGAAKVRNQAQIYRICHVKVKKLGE